MVHHKNVSLQQAKIKDCNLIEYMTRLGHEPILANKEITVFALRWQDYRDMILTINNELNQLVSVRIQTDGNVLDLACLVFNAKPEQILSDPEKYSLTSLISEVNDNQPTE